MIDGVEGDAHASKSRYREFLDALPIALYAIGADGKLAHINAAATALLNGRPVVGEERWFKRWKIATLDGAELSIDQSATALAVHANVELVDSEAIVERPDGVRRRVIVHPHVFRDVEGRVTGAVNAIVDVTERKSTEEALASTRNDLARHVDELERLHAQLSEVDARKDVFLATLAHELRNPLTPIRNAMHVIRLAGDNRAAVAATRGMVERQLSQLTRLVDDLLDVSRISRSHIELRKERVELQAVVREAIETESALIDHYGHKLDVAMPGNPLFVIADSARLVQIVSNLLNNAAKYTPPGGRIRVAVEPREGMLAVTVRDNGIGLPPDMLKTVFEMFTQVDTSLDKSRGGLGVGLALVKRLVEMHSGKVKAKSDGPGQGSAFIVTLPAADGAAIRGATDALDLPPMRREATRGEKRRILVVDDNVDLAASLAMMLEMLGHDVRIVHDGPAAIATVPDYAPDLVFLDIGMPRMNGFETCRRIREEKNGREAVIVALSGWGQEQDKERSRDAGMDLHLTKPFDPALLETMLAKIDGHRARASAEPREVPKVVDVAPRAQWEAANPRPVTEHAATDAEIGVEAARYALYRRIFPVLRHGLVGELQSVQFAVGLAKRACTRSGVGAETSEAIARIEDQAHAAIGRGQAMTDWLRPDPNATTTVGEAVHACLDLVGTEWSLRGIEVKTTLIAAGELVNAAVFRELCAAMLVAIGDAVQGAADVSLAVRRRGEDVVLSVRSRSATRAGEGARVSLYRDLRWSDVAALAHAQGVALEHRQDHAMARIPIG
ncbi:MAG TPA: ATP-binding protein [Casimicrobiaceae bacterium]|nr:ATP-binding protein [Casimicrobiaceae bacterium]